MKIPNTGGGAFPFVYPVHPCHYTEGMTLRDYFAAAALAGLLAAPEMEGGHEEFSRNAYGFADAMLEARKLKGRES